MIDWKQWSEKPNESNISKYPTITDIVEDIIKDEESDLVNKYPLSHNKTFISKLERLGKYCLVISSEDSNDMELIPASKSRLTLYRGQNEYYDKCLPSLFRCNDAAVLKARLQFSELLIFLRKHPILKDCVYNKHTIEWLAQHYGIPTHYLDLTTDKWVAAFFATTIYDNGNYYPVDITNPKHPKFGVLYRYSVTQNLYNKNTGKIHYIGMNYFNRPGRQSAAVIDLKDDKDLNSLVGFEKIFFRHDNDASNLIYSLSLKGGKYFPKDSLGQIIDKFLGASVFSSLAVDICRNTFYCDKSRKDFILLMYNNGFAETAIPQLTYTSDILQEIDEWNKEGRERYNRSIVKIPIMKYDREKEN